MTKDTSKNQENFEVIAENRRSKYDYAITDTYECGLVLRGTEVKSLRDRHVNFSDSYAILKNDEVFLLGLSILPFSHGTHENHEATRTRKLLLHKKEIKKIKRIIQEKGLTLIPLRMYFKNGRAKVLIGIAKGKTHSDKRQDIKRREADRDVARVMRRG